MKTNEYLYKMKNIDLNNFRCFSKLTLDFKNNINVLVGDNSSGKTTLIRALSKVLNSFFIGYSDENTRFYGLSKDDFTILQTNTGLANEAAIRINFNYLNVDAALELHSKKGRTLQKPLNPIYNLGKEFYNELFDNNRNQVKDLPLFASFSTTDIHTSRKISLTPFKSYEHKPSFGYYECLQGDGFLSYWTKRLLILKEAGKGELEIQGVLNAVLMALGNDGCNIIKEVQIRHNQSKIYYILTDNREVETDNLSDGYRRLLNIVIDIAFRSMILNKGIFGLDACLKTSGTVLIDEIDLHLHPTLQATVTKGLQKAFPKLQFVITTHAPMVMTGIPVDDNNIIYKLNFNATEGYTATPLKLYGMDASSIIEIALNTIPRSIEVDNRLNDLFNLIDEDKFPQAVEKLTKMKMEFGDNLPDLAKAQAMLNFLNEKNDNNK
jgi:predicted ATP-binding protein involved in virulence